MSKSRYHGDDDDVISGEGVKGLKPTCTIFLERELFKISQGDLGRGRGTPQVLDETIKAAGPETKSSVVFFRYVFERRGKLGTLCANDTAKRSSISSKRLANM